jgi:hypothetical protein
MAISAGDRTLVSDRGNAGGLTLHENKEKVIVKTIR